MSLVEPVPRSASVTAMSAAFVFRLPHDALRAMLSDDAHAASVLLVQIVKTLSERMRRANQMLSSVDMLADLLAGSMALSTSASTSASTIFCSARARRRSAFRKSAGEKLRAGSCSPGN
jgi:CRP-like cAMP-binding protein